MRMPVRVPLPDAQRDVPVVPHRRGASPLMADAQVRLIRGEEELGPQQLCRKCGEWWPAGDTEFWPSEMTLRGVCRACFNERKVRTAARRRRRVSELPPDKAQDRREYWRTRQQRWRDRDKDRRHAG